MNNCECDWTEWIERHGRALVAYAKQWAPHHADAEDVVQDAFVKFWCKKDMVHNITAYLYICVKRSALDWLRSKRKRPASPLLGDHTADDQGDSLFVKSGVLEYERQAAIETAVEQLPLKQREVLTMKIWGGLTFQQISEVVNVSPNTVASRYRYALENLEEILDKELVL